MERIQESKKIYTYETDVKPNRYAANAVFGVVLIIALAFLLNETGVFEIKFWLMRSALIVTAVLFVILEIIVSRKHWLENPNSKYAIMSIVILLTLVLTTLLNLYAVLALMIPLLLATQYRSYRISALALGGSCVCCVVAPLLSYFLHTWNTNVLEGLIETFCDVTITMSDGNLITDAYAVRQILLFWSLPQLMTLLGFGFILFSSTRSGKSSVDSQIRVADLSWDLSSQLESMIAMQEKVLYSMSDIIESRDVETGDHVRRTSEIVRMLMEEMQKDPQSGVTEEFCSAVIKSAPMHDLGKIAVSDDILHKPGRLSPEEFEEVKEHAEKSAEIIGRVLTGVEDETLVATAKNLALYHHERVDGTGYPEQLRGKDIPLEARIMAIADVYDALVSERCYKAPMSYEEAFRTIEESMGTQFDPDLNRYFLACRQRIEEFYKS